MDSLLSRYGKSRGQQPKKCVEALGQAGHGRELTQFLLPYGNDKIAAMGIVLKVNASQKYTTSGLSGAVLREVCRLAGVPVQLFANRADLPGGSTLGNLQSQSLPVPMADIGLAQLAMHSAVETASTADADAMVKAVEMFYRVHLRCLGDGQYTLEPAP